MELTLNIYKVGKYTASNEVIRVAKVQDFSLTLGACEDILNLINIDMFAGGLSSLSAESQLELISGIVKDGLPMFKEIIQEIFSLSDEEVKGLKIEEVGGVIIAIIKYAFSQLGKSIGTKNSKN